MSVVKINVLSVPEGLGEVLEERFAARAGEVEKVDGFESFELLRPTEGTDKYLVVTRWRDDEAFLAWMNSPAFQKGHARAGGEGADAAEGATGESAQQGAADEATHADGPSSGGPGHGAPDEGAGHDGGGHGGGGSHGGGGDKPAASGAELWGFEIVTSATKVD